MGLRPPVDVTGIYTLAAPFAQYVVPNVPYTCIAIRKFTDLIKKGEDPYQLYYAPMQMTLQEYQTDFNSGECLVTLRSADGQFIYVPTSKILGYPNQGGISYTALVLGIRLGAIPDGLDLTPLRTKLAAVCHDYIGVTPQIQQAAISKTVQKSAADHAVLEAARQAQITERQTDAAKLLAAQQTIAQQAVLIAQLQTYIQTRIPPT